MLAAPLAVLCASAPAEARSHRHRAAAAAHDDSVIALRRVAPGETWVVRQSTRLKKLVIAEGGHIEAPAGRTLTLSIDGVGTTVAPGSYAGEIALNVPLELRLHEPGLEGERPRAGLYVYSGLFLPEKSTAALLVGGRVGNGSAAGFSLASTEAEFVGAILAGSASYTLTAARIDVAGTGLLVSGSTQVTVAGGSHIAAGRTALRLSGQGSSVLLDGADVRAGNGLLAEFLPGAHALLRIRASRLAGNLLYATDAGALAALSLEGAALEGTLQARAGDVAGHAPAVSLDGASRWVVTLSTRLSALTLASGAVLVAPEGETLALFVDGQPLPLAPGSYVGLVELRVAPIEATAR
jgi:hypothetical protein